MEQSDNKYLNALYKAVSQDYEINDFDDFKARMEDDTKRKKWYDAIKDEYELQVNDYDEFSERVLGRPAQALQPEKTSQPAQSELVDNLSAMPQYDGTPTWRQGANANSPIDATSAAGAQWRDQQTRTGEWNVGGNIANGTAGTAAGMNGADGASSTANAGGLAQEGDNSNAGASGGSVVSDLLNNRNGGTSAKGSVATTGAAGAVSNVAGAEGSSASGVTDGSAVTEGSADVTGDAGSSTADGAGTDNADASDGTQEGTPMTDEEREAMSLLVDKMITDEMQSTWDGEARLNRITRAASPEGLREAVAGRFAAAAAGTPTHVIGFQPAPADGTDGSETDNDATANGNSAVAQLEKQLQVSGMSPQPHGVVYENGKPVTQWLLPDGTLTTSLLDASHAEYGAMESRLAEKFVGRMKENGLDPMKEEDVKRQEQLDYEAPIRNALDAVWQKAEEDDRKADEEYRNDVEKSRGGGFSDMLQSALEDAASLDASGLPMRTPTDARRDLKREVKRRETFNLEKIADEVYENIPPAYRDERLKEYSAYYRTHEDELEGRTVADAAKDALRGEAYGMVYEKAVQARLPKSKTEFLWRKLADQPMLSEAMATNMAASGLTGNYALEAAEMEAMGRYGAEHKTLDIVGTVANMAMDPTTYISGAAGSAVGKAMTTLGAKAVAKDMSKEVAERYFQRGLTSRLLPAAGRMVAGVGAGAGNFATFETLRNAQEQLRLGGSLNKETGERVFSAGDLLSATGRGLLLGSVTGMLSPIIGNVADKVVKSATSTAGKVGARAGEVAVSTLAEGTVFASPEWLENAQLADSDPNKRSNWDIWTDNLAMMLGFKASHAIKSAPRAIAELAPVAEPKTMAERNQNRMGFVERLRNRMDASPRDLDMTDEDISELHEYGYHVLGDLFKRRPEPKAPEAKDGAIEQMPYLEVEKVPSEFDGYKAMEQLMQDGRVSQAARAKAYYILTGRMLPMGTVTGCTREVAENGNIYVTSTAANGEAVTRRRFGSEAGAKAEEAKIMRTAELNSIDMGERYRETQANVRTLRTVVEAVAPGADFETVMQTYKKVKDGDEAVTEAYGEMVAKIDEALALNRGMFDGERPAAIREAVKKETGVDVDKAIRKTIDGRTEAEAGAVKEYLERLYGDETKREADAAYDDSRINWGRVEEGDAEAKADADETVRKAGEAERNCEAAFGADAERRMAELKSDAWSMLSDLSLTEEQRAAVKEYIKATEALRGMTDAANEHADERRAAVQRDVERRTNRETGMIVPAVMKVGDRKVYVVKGRIVQHSDKSGIDVRNSDKEILVYDPERDAVEFASPDQVLNLEYAIDPSVEIEQAMNDIQREQEVKMQPQRYRLNEELTLNDEDGKPMKATIVAGANEDGLYQVQTEKPINGRVVNLMSVEQIDALLHKEAAGNGQKADRGGAQASGKNAPGNGGNVQDTVESVQKSDESVQTAGAGGAVSESAGTRQAEGNSAGSAGARAEKTVRGVRNNMDGTYSKIYEDGSEATFDMENRLVSEKPAPTDNSMASEAAAEGAARDGGAGVQGPAATTGGTTNGANASVTGNTPISETNTGVASATPASEQKVTTEATAESGIGVANTTVASEQTGATATAAAWQGANQTSQMANEPMPMVGEGENAEPDFKRATPLRAHDYLYNESGLDEETANDFVDNNLAEAEKAVKRLAGKKPKIGTSIAKFNKENAEWQKSVAEANAMVDYWNQVKLNHEEAVTTQSAGGDLLTGGTDNRPADEKGVMLTEQEADSLIERMEADAEMSTEKVLSSETWAEVFDENNSTETPIGRVKMGEHQIMKFFDKNRANEFGMVGPTLNNPDVIIEEPSEAKDGNSERASSFVFVKTFNRNGEKVKFYASITVKQDGMEVSVSSHYIGKNAISKKLLEGKVIYTREALLPNSSERHLAEHRDGVPDLLPTQESNAFPGGKGSEAVAEVQEKVAEKLKGYGSFTDEATSVEELPDDMAYRETDVNELEDVVGHMGLRALPEGKSVEGAARKFTGPDGKAHTIGKTRGNSHGGKAFSKGAPWSTLGGTLTRGKAAKVIIGVKGDATEWRVGHHGSYSEPTAFGEIEDGQPLFLPFDENGKVGGIGLSQMRFWVETSDGRYREFVPDEDLIDEKRQNELLARLTETDEEWAEKGEYGEVYYQKILLDGKEVVKVDEPDESGNYTGSYYMMDGNRFGDLYEVAEYVDSQSLQKKVEAAEAETDTEPTDGQKAAGNYRKGHVQVGTFDISIEQPKGSVRSGVDANGKEWHTEMKNTYGYIRGTEGVDGDHIDVFLSDDIDGWNGRKVYVVDQYNEDGTFDEHKVMMGFNGQEDAWEAYLANYEKGWENGRKLSITPTNLEDFEKWIESSHRKTKPFEEYKSVKLQAEKDGDIAEAVEEVKAEDPDVMVMVRKGNMYHIYGEDAKKAAVILGIGYDDHENPKLGYEAQFPLAGLDVYLPRVIRAGVRVAVMDLPEKKYSKTEAMEMDERRKAAEKETAPKETVSPSEKRFGDSVVSDDAGAKVREKSDVASQTGGNGSATAVTGTEPSVKYSITATNYTNKKGKETPMSLVKFDGELTKEQERALNEFAKERMGEGRFAKVRGWRDRETGGWLFRSEEDARKAAAMVNDEEALQDEQPLTADEMRKAAGLENVTATDGNDADVTEKPANEIWIDEAMKPADGLTEAAGRKKADAEKPANEVELDDAKKEVVYGDVTAEAYANRNGFNLGDVVTIGGERGVLVGVSAVTLHPMVNDMDGHSLMVTNWSDMKKAPAAAGNRASTEEKPAKTGAEPAEVEPEDRPDIRELKRKYHKWNWVYAYPKPGQERFILHSRVGMNGGIAIEWFDSDTGKMMGDGENGMSEREFKDYMERQRLVPSEYTYRFIESVDREIDKVERNMRRYDKSAQAGRKLVITDEMQKDEDVLRDLLGIGDDEVDDGMMFRDPEGLTPEQKRKVFAAGVNYALGYIDQGYVTFPEFAKAMAGRLGYKIKPWLKSFYEGAKRIPGYDTLPFTPTEEVDRYDVENMDKPSRDIVAEAQMVAEEAKAKAAADKANKELKETRNERRKENDEQRAADTVALAEEAGAVASEARAVAKGANDERTVNRSIKKVDEALRKVNNQLALIGYYKANEVEKDYNEATGYMRNAERKAVKDAAKLAGQLIDDLGLDRYEATHGAADRKGNRKVKPLATANLAPVGGNVTIHLPLTDGRELYINIGVDAATARYVTDYGGSNLQVTGIMYRVENPNGSGDRYGNNCFVGAAVKYGELLRGIQREAYEYLPARKDAKEGEYKAGDKVEYTTDGGRTWSDGVVVSNEMDGITIDSGYAPVMYVNVQADEVRHKGTAAAPQAKKSGTEKTGDTEPAKNDDTDKAVEKAKRDMESQLKLIRHVVDKKFLETHITEYDRYIDELGERVKNGEKVGTFNGTKNVDLQATLLKAIGEREAMQEALDKLGYGSVFSADDPSTWAGKTFVNDGVEYEFKEVDHGQALFDAKGLYMQMAFPVEKVTEWLKSGKMAVKGAAQKTENGKSATPTAKKTGDDVAERKGNGTFAKAGETAGAENSATREKPGSDVANGGTDGSRKQTERTDLPQENRGEAQQEPGAKVAEKPRMGTEQAVSEAFNGALDSAEERGERTAEQRKFAMAVKDDMLAALENGTKPYRSIVDLRKRAKSLGMDVDAWGRTDILLQELVEDGLVRAAREAVSRYGRDSKESYDAVCKLYEMQPTIAARSSNRIKMQQYSTPLPMAWNAAHFAMSGKADGKVLEPTAGNGMLVFAVPAEQVRANELDGTRLANLMEQGFGEVTNQDATLPFEGGKQYDVVIANPPFGSMEAKEYDGKLIGGLDPQITLNALEAMKDDGRAAIIIGGNMEYASNGALKGQKAFLTYLYDHYNVKGVVDMDGKLYQKQGTGYPTRMILIEGRRSAEERTQSVVYPPVQSKAVRKATNFGDLYDIVNEIINSKEKTNGTEVLRSQQRQPVSDSVGTTGRGDRMADTGQHRTDDGDGRGRGRGADSKGAVSGGERVLRGTSGPDNGDGSEGLRAGGDNRGLRRGTDEPVAGGVDRVGAARGGVGLTQPQERRNATTKEPEKRTLTEEKLPYRPHNSAFSLQSVAPAAMVEAMDKTLARIEEQYGAIDEFLTSELGYDTVEEAHNALAAEQMDSVAMAIYQMKQGQALIIGDQTGVGKGRQMAALIRWAVKQGKKPIFMTQKADLFSDIYRDLVDVGSGDLVPFIFNSPTGKENRGEMVDANGNVVYKGLSDAKQKKVFATGELPEECDYAVLTYSQVNTGDEQSRQEANEAAKKGGKRTRKSKSDGKDAPKATFLRKIAKGNYLFLDESHTAAGESNTGAYLQSILKDAEACTFASATFAKRPDTMPLYALRTAMSKAKIESNQLINVIASGGVTLQEIMSRELTAAGQMVRRERDMSDVKTDWKTISDEATVKRARENYDKTIEAFNAIIKFQRDYIEPFVKNRSDELAEMASSAGLTQGTEDMGLKNVPFASKTYNYTKQLMLALKADAIVDEVAAEIEAGRHPVIALESTMEANIEDYNDGEVIAEPTFSASLRRGLDSVMQYTEDDSNGKKSAVPIRPEQLGPEGERAYYELVELIRKATADVYISPLDDIIAKLRARGYKVGELTGRDKYVEVTDDGRSIVRKRTDKDKKRMQREFNSGALDVLILNKSASTGISLHASEKFSDQRQRTMIIAQPLSDINDYMQMIGRIDRTGQVHRGYYINLGLPVPAESRFLMMLSTKLKSLNANTTTSQDSESNEVAAPDMLNKYGSQVVIEYLRDNPDIYEKMGKPIKGGAKGEPLEASALDDYKPQEDDARRITGCAALLSTKEQDDFYNDVTRRYNELINYLNETGSNDLKITVMPLRAETKDRRVTSRGTDPNGENPFAKDAYVETVEMDVLRKPMKAAEVKKVMEQVCRGLSPADYLEQVTETLRNEAYAKIDAENERYEKAKEKMDEEVAKQTGKINASKKLTHEEKQNAIANYTASREAEVENRHKANVDRIKATGNDLYRKLRKFETGKSYLVPDSLEGSMFNTASPAIFCGYKTKEQKITASTTLAVFATLDGRRRVEVKLSEGSALNRIEEMTLDNLDSARRTTLENWDSQIPTETRKTGHILTGNILQAIADTQDETGHFQGQLISYTDMEGNIHDGILMPDKWKVSSLKSSGVPLAARMEQIRNYEPVVSRDGKVKIEGSRWSRAYYLSVPRTKKDGAIYFENKTILKNVENQVFYPFRGQLRADILGDKIESVVKELTRLGVTVKDDTLEKEEGSAEKYRDAGAGEYYNMGDAPDTFEARRKLAVGNMGTVMPGLNDAEVKVVKDIPRHSYTGNIIEATEQAIDAAKKKYVPNGSPKVLRYDNFGEKFSYIISGNAIETVLSPKHQGASVNKGVHLALAEHLDRVIAGSIEVEEHPDRIKTNGARDNYKINPDALMHRFYGVARIDGKDYRVMTLMKEDGRPEGNNGIHSYEVQKIEVLDEETPNTSNGVGTPNSELEAYPLAKVLKDVGKTMEKDKNLLAESKKVDEGFSASGAKSDENAMTERVNELAESLNTPIRIVRTAEEAEQLPSARQRRMKGSFNPLTGEVTVVVPNNENVADVENTVLHEVVGHDGLRVLFPEEEKLNNALDELYNASEEGIRRTIDGTARKMYDAEVERLRAQMRKGHEAKGEDAEASYYADMAAAHAEAGKKKEKFRRDATEEYGADLAGRIGEEGFEKMSREEQTFWGRLKAMLQKALGRLLQGLGIPKMKAWTDKEWAFVLHEAYKRKKNGGRPDVFDMADTEVMRHKTGFDEAVMRESGREERTSAAGKGLLFRDGDPEMRGRKEVRERYERKMHNGLYQTQEAFQDSMLALKEAMEMTVGKGTYIEDIADYENPYLGENRLSRVNKAENDAMERTLFKPLYEEVAKLAKDKADRLELTDYMMAKHGLERNDVMARRAAQKVVREEYEDRIKVAEAAVNNDPLDQDAIDTLDALKREAAAREAELYAENRQRDYSGLTTLMSTEPSVHAIREQTDALKEQLPKESDPDVRKNMREQISLLKQQLLDAAEDEANKFVFKYEMDHETTDLWNRVNAVNAAILDKQYESGLISEETYKDISGMYTHYIPLRGFDEKTSDEVYAYINQKENAFNAPVKKAKGRTSKADDPIANMKMMAESGIAAGNRNTLVKQRMLNFVLNHPTDLVSVGELWLQHDDVTDEWVPVFPDNIDETDGPAEVEQKMADFEQKMEGLAKSDPSHYKHGKDAEDIPYRVLGMKEKQQHVVIAKRGGKDYVMTVNGNPRLAQALNGLTNPDNDSQGAVGKIISVVGGVNRVLSGLYTTYQPDFMASNFARDAVYANSMVWVKESPKYARAFNKHYMTLPRSMSLLGKYRKGELDPRNKTHVYFDEFMRNGGEVGFLRMLDIEKQKKKLQKAIDAMHERIPARAVCDCIGTWLGEISRGIEMRARFAAYVTSREAGRSVGRSIWDASEISVNFPKKGAGDRFLKATGQTRLGNVAAGVSGVGRAGYIFWNAALQGTFGNFLKTALRHPKKMSVMASIALTAGFLVPALAKLRDDEEDSYFDLPKHTRRQNLVVKMPLKSWLKMPLSIEQRSIYGLGEMLGCAVFNNEPLETEDVMVQLSQMLPIDMMEGWSALWPSAVKPATEAIGNETWYGSPIWKETPWNEHAPNWTKAYKSANPDLVALAEWLNESKLSGGDKYSGGRIDLNPAQMEYLLKQYTGGFFTVVNQVRNLVGVTTGEKEFDWRYVPLVNRAVMSGGDERNAGHGLNEKFYYYMDEYEALNQRFNSIKKDREVDFEEKGRLIGELLQNPMFLTMRRYDTQYRKLQTAINESRSLGQEELTKDLEKQMKVLKQKAVSEMEGQ